MLREMEGKVATDVTISWLLLQVLSSDWQGRPCFSAVLGSLSADIGVPSSSDDPCDKHVT